MLGYPTKNALKTWHQEYEKRLNLAAGCARLQKYSRVVGVNYLGRRIDSTELLPMLSCCLM